MRVSRVAKGRVARLHIPRSAVYEDGPRGFHRDPTGALLVVMGDSYSLVDARTHSKASSV